MSTKNTAKPSSTELKLQEAEAEVARLQQQVDHKNGLLDRKNATIADLEAEVGRLRTRLDDNTTVAAQTTGVVRASEGQITKAEFERIVKDNSGQVFIVLEDFQSPDGPVHKHANMEARQFPQMGWWIDSGLRVMPKARTAKEVEAAEAQADAIRAAAQAELAAAEARVEALRKKATAA